jgi:hypothetical protein
MPRTRTFTVEVNGYEVAERLLEDVLFDAVLDLTPGRQVTVTAVTVRPDHAGYFSQFNEKKWLDEIRKAYSDFDHALEAVSQEDAFEDRAAWRELCADLDIDPDNPYPHRVFRRVG